MAQSTFALTMDTDWAPQFVIDDIVNLLENQRIPATIFCTGPYLGLDTPLIEPGLHPNFLPGSTHGATEKECLAHLCKIWPSALGMRSHCYWWHNRMCSCLNEFGIRYDSSLLTPFQPMLRPYSISGITRFPVWFGDNLHMTSGRSFEHFDYAELSDPGLKVLLFHPVHVYLNSRSIEETRAAIGSKDLPSCTEKELLPKRRSGAGMRTLFLDALRVLQGEKSCLLKELL